MLLVSFFAGLGVAGQWNLPVFLLLGATLSLYLARYPLVLWARAGYGHFPQEGWFTFVAFASLGLLLGVFLILRYELWLLLPLAIAGLALLLVHLYLVRRRQERSEAGEFAGLAALTLAAPAAFYAARGTLSSVAFLLWFLSFLYFGTTVFYVKREIARRFAIVRAQNSEEARLTGALILYQAVVLGSLALLSYLRLVPALTFLAFGPLTLQVIFSFFKPRRPLNIRQLGLTLVSQSVVYGLVLIAVFRASSFIFPG